MLKNMPPELAMLVDQARFAKPTRETALKALRCLDLTSLNADDTPEKIDALLAKADQKEFGHAAAVCVYPQFVKQAFNAIAAKGINRATVINFPSGKGSPKQTAADTKSAIAAGANEIDIVFDYDSFLKGDRNTATELILVCANACTGKARLKVILESAVFNDYNDLFEASVSAIAAGAGFLKTSTGKSDYGGASLEAAATLIRAAALFAGKLDVGVKISGGVRTVADAAQYLALADSMRGSSWATPDNFRFGASGVMNDILRVLGGEDSKPPAPGPAAKY